MCSRDGGYVFIILEAPCSLTTILSTSSNSRDQGLVGSDGGPFSSTKCLCKPFFFHRFRLFLFCTSKKREAVIGVARKSQGLFSLSSPLGC